MVEQSLLHVTLNMNRRQQTRRSEASLEAIERLSVLIQKSEFKIPGQAAYRCAVSEPGGPLSLLPGSRCTRGFPCELRCRDWGGGLLGVSVGRLTRSRRFF